MSHPPPDPITLLEDWESWERGERLPGQTMSDLKRHGLDVVLKALVDDVSTSAE